MHAAVVVLGDVGRSPRMQYHCMSLADSGAYVSLVGYHGESCADRIEQNPRISKRLFSPMQLPKHPKLLYISLLPFKALFMIFQLLWILISLGSLDVILVQNPPSIPLLTVAWLVAKLRNARLVIDWHNFGFSMLSTAITKPLATVSQDKISPAQTIGHNSLTDTSSLVRFARWYEKTFASRADLHLCVSSAMRSWLKEHFHIQPRVLYDRPPSFFCATSLHVRHDLFRKIASQLPSEQDIYTRDNTYDDETIEWTIFTKKDLSTGHVTRRPGCPALLLSSTSWTDDEDFGILLDAVVQLDSKIAEKQSNLPKFVIVVTGKGPLKQYYMEQIERLQLRFIHIRTLWLEFSDYPRLVGAADLGICLHTSTSGLDLPMKVVDMFGCNLPVCAIEFEALPELVHHGKNGYIFQTSQELAKQLMQTFDNYTVQSDHRSSVQEDAVDNTTFTDPSSAYYGGTETLQQFRQIIKQQTNNNRWETQWYQQLGKLLGL